MTTTAGAFLQVLNSHVYAIAHEMAENVLRAAHSAFIKETWDLAALLTTPSGEVFACPKEVGAKRLGMHLGPALAHTPSIRPADIFVSNDVERTGGLATHLTDVFFWKPIFSGDELVCFALVFVHVSDIGGMVPGSITPSSVELFQEGLRIPPVRLFKGGELQAEVRDMILANSRVPGQLWGDMMAVVGALNIAERRVQELLQEHSAAEFRRGTEHLLDLSEARARDLIREIPNGRYPFVDFIDGLDGLDPIRLAMTLVVDDDTITMDFTGSDPEVRASYNLYSHSQNGHWNLSRAFADYFQTCDPDVPWNNGLVRPIKVLAPKGTILNPRRPLACGTRVATFFRVYYMVFGALARAIPGKVPSSGPGEAGIMLVATHDPETGARRINVGQTLFGGGGARAVGDGFTGNEMVSCYLRNVPIEILEQEMPVRFVEYGIAPSTGGAGRYRGGHGVRLTIEFQVQDTTVTIRGLQRHQFRAWGVGGGRAGKPGEVVLNPGTDREQFLTAVTVLDFQAGDRLRVTTAGGGGFGSPLEREPAMVAREVAEGLLDPAEAHDVYSVVLRDGNVDAGATGARRRQLAAAAPPPSIDYGPEREAFESVWTPALYTELQRLTSGLPPNQAQSRRQRIIDLVKARVAEGAAPDPTALAELLQAPPVTARA